MPSLFTHSPAHIPFPHFATISFHSYAVQTSNTMGGIKYYQSIIDPHHSMNSLLLLCIIRMIICVRAIYESNRAVGIGLYLFSASIDRIKNRKTNDREQRVGRMCVAGCIIIVLDDRDGHDRLVESHFCM